METGSGSRLEQNTRIRLRKPGKEQQNLPEEHRRLTGSGCGTGCEAGWSWSPAPPYGVGIVVAAVDVVAVAAHGVVVAGVPPERWEEVVGAGPDQTGLNLPPHRPRKICISSSLDFGKACDVKRWK